VLPEVDCVEFDQLFVEEKVNPALSFAEPPPLPKPPLKSLGDNVTPTLKPTLPEVACVVVVVLLDVTEFVVSAQPV
jgi:hypothetical protein